MATLFVRAVDDDDGGDDAEFLHVQEGVKLSLPQHTVAAAAAADVSRLVIRLARLKRPTTRIDNFFVLNMPQVLMNGSAEILALKVCAAADPHENGPVNLTVAAAVEVRDAVVLGNVEWYTVLTTNEKWGGLNYHLHSGDLLLTGDIHTENDDKKLNQHFINLAI